MTKVLFICHGNICRSPMAEFILKDMVEKRGIAEDFQIASVATSTEEIWGRQGNPVYPPAREELARHGISCDGKHATLLQKSDYQKYDYLICMDSANVRNATRMVGGDPDGKIYKMLAFVNNEVASFANNKVPQNCRDVADPWYSGDFERTYDDIVAGCEGFLRMLGDY